MASRWPGRRSRGCRGRWRRRCQGGGAGEPVVDHAVAQGEFGDLGEVGGDRRSSSGSGSVMQRDAARADGAAQQPVPGDAVVDAQQLFADALGVGVGQGEADVVAQGADVGDVVVEAFEFEQQGPQPVRVVGQVDAEGVLDGQAVGQGVADGGVAADPFGQLHAHRRRCGLGRVSRCPRWTNHSRALSCRMVSPTTENRKWPGSIRPACTGPTGISYTPVPSTVRNGKPSVAAKSVRPRRRGASGASLRASARAGPGGAGRGWPSGAMPNRSCISRSNRPAGNDSYASDGSDGLSAGTMQCRVRRGGRAAPARNRYTTRSAVAVVVGGDQRRAGNPRCQEFAAARRRARSSGHAC